ncbi:NAD(P)-binding domain-containing protein [Streptomyces sp. NBC_00316]|uniref:NAD(P)-binding domain-containing protein n=1 Tax=Streptomyces sp. NBC_00316 TaxID=2975710 RepID=UPI003FA6B485
MGFQLAARLLDAGHDVAVFNRTRSKAEPLAERGSDARRPAGRSGRPRCRLHHGLRLTRPGGGHHGPRRRADLPLGRAHATRE